VNQSKIKNRVELPLPIKRHGTSLGICHRSGMAPSKFGGPSAAVRKHVKRPVASPEVEEVVRASNLAPPAIFHRDYLPS
jgi:hypothetical protein